MRNFALSLPAKIDLTDKKCEFESVIIGEIADFVPHQREHFDEWYARKQGFSSKTLTDESNKMQRTSCWSGLPFNRDGQKQFDEAFKVLSEKS